MAQDTYNGWTNYETWNAYLWQRNVESTYKFFLEKAKHYSEMAGDDSDRVAAMADFIKIMVEHDAPNLPSSMYQDILANGLSRIDYYALAKAWLDDAKA